MELPEECFIIWLSILGLALILHIVGIYCCLQEKLKLKNQKVILLNLSAVEVMLILYTMGHLTCAQFHHTAQTEEIANKTLCTLYHGLTSLFYNSMTLIPCDRLLCILSPHRYLVHVRASTLRKTASSIWVFSLIWPLPFVFVPLSTHIEVIRYYSYGAQALFVLISIITYILVWRSQSQHQQQQAVKRKNGKEGLRRHSLRQAESSRQTFRVSFSLVASFVVLYIAPNYVPTSSDHGVETFITALTYCGLAVDPILYLLVHSALRPIILKVLTPWKKSSVLSNTSSHTSYHHSRSDRRDSIIRRGTNSTLSGDKNVSRWLHSSQRTSESCPFQSIAIDTWRRSTNHSLYTRKFSDIYPLRTGLRLLTHSVPFDEETPLSWVPKSRTLSDIYPSKSIEIDSMGSVHFEGKGNCDISKKTHMDNIPSTYFQNRSTTNTKDIEGSTGTNGSFDLDKISENQGTFQIEILSLTNWHSYTQTGIECLDKKPMPPKKFRPMSIIRETTV